MTDTTICAFEGGPAVTTRTGKTGNVYGVCRECADSLAASDRRERIRTEALAELDGMREALRERGACTPAVERFINEVSLLVQVDVSPGKAMDWVLSVMTRQHVTVRA